MDNYNQEFSNYTVIDSQPAEATGVVAKRFMANVFLWMFIALGVSTLLAVLYATNQTLFQELYSTTVRNGVEYSRPSMLGWVVTFAPFAFIIIMQIGLNKFSAAALTFLFLAFAAVMGISLSYILIIYTTGFRYRLFWCRCRHVRRYGLSWAIPPIKTLRLSVVSCTWGS